MTNKEDLCRYIEFLIDVAEHTRAAGATSAEGRKRLTRDISRLRAHLRTVEAYLPEDMCEIIHSIGGCAFEVGQYAGMIDDRVRESVKHIRSWRGYINSAAKRQAEAAEKKELLRGVAEGKLARNSKMSLNAIAAAAVQGKITTLGHSSVSKYLRKMRKELGLIVDKEPR
jgi:hypothetical protein